SGTGARELAAQKRNLTPRKLPKANQDTINSNRAQQYRKVQADVKQRVPNIRELRQTNLRDIQGTVLSIGACQDNEVDSDDGSFGFLTTGVSIVWSNGAFNPPDAGRSLDNFFANVARSVEAHARTNGQVQRPNLDAFGAAADSFRQSAP